MNKKGEIEVKDFGALFLIYILLMTTIATSADISFPDNSTLPSPKQEEAPQPEPEHQSDQPENTTQEQKEQSQLGLTEPEPPQNQSQSCLQEKCGGEAAAISPGENTTLIPQSQSNQSNNSLVQNQTPSKENTRPSAQSASNYSVPQNQPRTELIQHSATVGQKVKWTKRTYKTQEAQTFSIQSAEPEYTEETYETPAPKQQEKNTPQGKQILIYSEEHYTNVTATTSIPFNITNKEQLSLYWLEEQKYLPFQITDQNITWTVPHLSNQTFELSINVINTQSYPVVGGEWKVNFQTIGKANLTILGINGTEFDKDLRFLELYCGEEEVTYQQQDNKIFIENYECNETSSETSRVITPGKHHLEFKFGTATSYAHNAANDFKTQRGYTIFTTGQATATITAGVDYDVPTGEAFIKITNTRLSGMGTTTSGGNQNVDDFTTNIQNPSNLATSINFERFGTTNDNRITWEIVEYTGPISGPNEFKVREASTITFTTTDITATTATISNVQDDNDMVVFITGQANPDTGRTDANTGMHTSSWNDAGDTATFTRGEASGDATRVSYAAVEFTGENWKVQRTQHSYTSAGTIETETITQVSDLTKTFLHVQHQPGTGLGGLDEQGSEVYLSTTSTVAFQLVSGAGTANQISVAWIIENTESLGTPMRVQHISGTRATGGAEEDTWTESITAVDAINTTSIMGETATSTGTGTAFPRGFNTLTLLNTTTVELKQSDSGQTQAYRFSVVQWPTAPPVDYPQFTNPAVAKPLIAASETVRFSIDIADPTSQIDSAFVTIDDINRSLTKGAGDSWYYDYTCTFSGTVYMTYANATDDGPYQNSNTTTVSGVSTECDATFPIINFELPTPSSPSSQGTGTFTINTSITEKNFQNITYFLYDSSGLINQTTYTSNTPITYQNLPTETYWYNATTTDQVGQSTSTPTRTIYIDSQNPLIEFSGATYPSGTIISGNQITYEVSVTEPNEKNITFTLVGPDSRENTYTDSHRSVTWTLLPDGFYEYNVTIFDIYNHKNFTTTRNITLDNALPITVFESPTEPHETHKSQNYIFINSSTTEDYFQNITFSLFNASGIQNQTTYTSETNQINFTNLANGVYQYNITVYDKAGNSNTSETREITLDTINPIVDFAAPTEANNNNVSRNWILVNSTITETNFQNIIFSLYDSSGLINQTTLSEPSINFTNLDSKIYFYNITVTDSAGNQGSSPTRQIGLDLQGPSININSPQPKAYGTDTGLSLDATAIDPIAGLAECWYNIDNTANISLTCNSPTTFDTTSGSHTLYYFANDTFSNLGTALVTFLVSTTGPAISLDKPSDETFYSSATSVFFSYSTTDPDGVETCSLFGTWNGGWHLNQTDFSFGLIGNDTVRTCSQTWPALDCGASPLSSEGDNTMDSCVSQGTTADESIEEMWLSATEIATGKTLEATCYIDPYGTDNEVYMWYHNGTAWKNIYTGIAPSGTNYNLTQSFTVDNAPGQHWVRCGIGYDADDVTDFCVNAGSYFDNDDTNFTVVEAKESGNFTVDLSTEGSYSWNVECNDSLSYYTSALSNYSLAIDTTAPIVDFGLNTAPDNSRTPASQIYVNTSIQEANLENITFYLFDSNNASLSTDTTSPSKTNFTWTSLSSGIYYYNFTATDKASRSTSSTTRRIELDLVNPSGSNQGPTHNSYTNIMQQNFTAIVEDLVELKDATLFIYNSTGDIVFSNLISLVGLTSVTIGQLYTFLYDDIFSWFYQIKDSVNNEYNTTASTITVDNTLPQITFIQPTFPDDSVVLQDFITLNTSVYEENYKNITFSLYDSSGLKSQNPYTDSTRHINWTTLSNGIYQYNVTVFDKAGNEETSQTRTIILDTAAPELTFSGITKPDNAVIKGSSISLEVTATESNEQNITFSLFGTEERQITYLDGRRQVTWTLLPEGTYQYNVTMVDKVNQVGSTTTRTITLDNTAPTIDYTSPTQTNNANKSQNFIPINTSVTEQNFQNITFTLFNQTSLVSSQTFTDDTRFHNFTNLPNEIYTYNVTTSDKAGNINFTGTQTITLDTINPTTSFIAPTESTDVVRNRNWVFLNTSVTEQNFKQIIFYIYSEIELVDSQSFTDSTREYNFTNLPDGNYQYNATTTDWSGNTGSTETRNIGLDGAGPIVDITKPRAKTYGYNESLPLEHTVSDKVSTVESCWWNIDGGSNQSITCGASTTFNTSVATHTINFFANDTFGNIGSDSVTFFISITGPAIELIKPSNDTFYAEPTEVNFSFTSADPDGTDTCSLYGDWNGAWHKNQTYSGGWQDLGSKHRQDIVISNTGSTALTNFPTYLNIPSTYTHTGDYLDLKFFNGSCSEEQSLQLSHNVEYYNATSADVWARIPTLPTSGQAICLYYGNENSEDTEDEAAVWNSDYSIVYHMDAAGLDSTSNNNNKPANIGSPAEDDSFLGDGIAFSSGNAWDLKDLAYWELGYGTRTHEVVFETSLDTSTRQVIFAEGGSTNGIMMYIYNNELYARWWISSNDNFVSIPISASTKYHAVMTYQNPGNYALYLNGQLAGSGATSFAVASHTGDGAIGYTGANTKDFQDTYNIEGFYFTGSIFEVRASDTFQTLDFANQTYQSIFNQQDVVSHQSEENFTAFQVSIHEEGSYIWNIECNDTIGYDSMSQANFSFIIDVTPPQVFFGSSTEDNDSVVGRNWIFADTNIIENNFQNITFYLYNQTQLIDTDTFTDDTRQTNFTNLVSGTYYYNITVYDRANSAGHSETRIINLDLSPPTGDLNSPLNNAHLNNLVQNLTATFNDATGLLNATIVVLNETGSIIHTATIGLAGALSATVGIIYDFLEEGIYSWFYQIEDVVGNKVNLTSNTLTMDTTAPTIDFTTGTENSGTFFAKENIFVNVTSTDTYWKNITFDLYDTTSQVFSHTFSDGTKQIEWTPLPDAIYFYNVTAYDSAGNFNSSNTRNITLDNLDPTITFTDPTIPDEAIISGDAITLAVSVTEANEANITFNLYDEAGANVKSNTFQTPQRSLTWNLLSEGTYTYNVTVVDKLNHEASTLTRSITLDATAPQVEFGFQTLPDNTHINQDWIFARATITETHFQNVTFTLYNSTGQLSQSTFTDTTRIINFTNLVDGDYWYQITSCDQASNCNTSTTRYTTLDSISPQIQFELPTEITNFNKTENWIFINISIDEINLQSTTFNLYDQSGLINQTTSTSKTINFTNLDSKVYWYNVTTLDKAGNFNTTEERRIGLDYLGPTVQIINPKPKAYGTNVSLPLDHNIYDNIVGLDKCWYNIDNGPNTTISCTADTTFNTTPGTQTLHLFANDTFGNIGYKNVTFLVSITGPAIQLFDPVDNTFYSQGTEVFFNYTAEDPDLTESCSLWGSWNGGWHINQTDFNWNFGAFSETEEDFEAANPWIGWTEVGDATGCLWTRATSTTSGSTGPTGGYGPVPQGSSYFLYTEASSGDNCEFDAGNHWTSLESDFLDADMYNITLDFWYHMYGAAMGSLSVDVNNSGGWTNDVWTLSGQQQSAEGQDWEPASVNLAEYSGTIKIRIRAEVGTAYTSDISIDQAKITSDPRFIKTQGNFTLNLSEEGTSKWNVECNDTKGYYTTAAANYSITFDVTNPQVDFGLNTPQDNANLSQNYIYINSSIIENNYRNMTFYLYDQSGLVDSHFQNDSSRDHTFTGLDDNTYYYNFTVYDSASRVNSTQTRTILLDTKSPEGNLNTPLTNTITNTPNQNLTATFSDENGLVQAILYIYNSTGLVHSQIIPLVNQLSVTIGTIYNFLTDGKYQWFYQAEDIVGNKFNTTNYTITLDTTLPQIQFISSTLPNDTHISQSNIYLNTSVIESAFQNITFSLFNGEGVYDSYTFSTSKRDINYTLLPDDEYFYNVTVHDKAGNSNTSETRIITLDRVAPQISYTSPTEISSANKSQNFIQVNTSITEINFANITFQLYLENTLVNTTTYQSEISDIIFTSLVDGTYNYNVTITDKAGSTASLPKRTITLDTIHPNLFFVDDPTEPSGAILEQDLIEIKTFVSDANFKNITYYLYNSSQLLNQTTYLTPVTEINFTAPGTNITYFYNATATDIAGNKDSTQTRNITLIDTTHPTLNLISPENKTYTYNTGIRINYQASDAHLDTCWYNLNDGANITMPNCQSTLISVPDEQSHKVTVYVNDSMGYTISDNVTFFVNSSLINLPEIYSVQHGSVFTNGAAQSTIQEIHPTKAFILHTVRGSSHAPNNLQVTSDFTSSEEIEFKNYNGGSGVLVEWSVIGGPNISAQRGEAEYTTEEQLNITLPQVNLSNTFIIVNNRLDSSDQTTNTQGFWTAKFSDDTTATFTRDSSSTTSGTLSYQIVEWQGASVQSGAAQIADTSISQEESISQINENKTFLISSTSSSSNTIQDSMTMSAIKNSNTLLFNRTASTGDVNIEWFTVQSPLFESQHGTYIHETTASTQYPQIPMSLVNISRSFDTHSNKNSGTASLFANAFLSQNIHNTTAIALQKGTATSTGTTAWSAIEITELDAPEITLEYPINTQNFSTYTIPQFDFTIEDESAILNCSLYGNWSTGWHLNQTIFLPAKDTTISFSDIGVSTDGYYVYNIECTDAYENKAFSNQNFTFAAFLPPTNPTIYNITQTSNDGTGDIILSWNKSDHSSNYEIYTGPTLSTMTYLTQTTEENYTDATFAGNKRRFYQVIATNPTGENASEIFSAHLYELKHNTIKSRNWIAFPSNFSYIKDANETLKEVPQSTAFTTFNATTQSRITCNEFSCPETLSCTSTNCNFKSEPGKSYEVNINTSLSQAVNWSAVGRVHESQTVDLTKNATSFGKNWISIPADTSLSNAQGLIINIPNADAISKWNAESQISAGLIPSPIPWIPGFIGTNFQLNLEEGYEVSVTSSGTWTQS